MLTVLAIPAIYVWLRDPERPLSDPARRWRYLLQAKARLVAGWQRLAPLCARPITGLEPLRTKIRTALDIVKAKLLLDLHCP